MRGEHTDEVEVQKDIRRSVKLDRRNYLDEFIKDGMYSQLKELRRGPQKMKGNLRNLEGSVVFSEKRAEII